MKRNSGMRAFGWDPFREVTQLQKQMNQIFESFFHGSDRSDYALAPGTGFAPATDVYEDQNGLKLRIEIPGIQPDDAEIALDQGMLTVKGERKFPEDGKTGCYLAMESPYGPFFRSFVLPNSVDPATPTANYVNGVLEISMAKRAEAQPKQIPINGKAKALGTGAPSSKPA